MSFSRLSPNMLSVCFGVISGRFIAQKLLHFVPFCPNLGQEQKAKR
jgi:hypothetical protein